MKRKEKLFVFPCCFWFPRIPSQGFMKTLWLCPPHWFPPKWKLKGFSGDRWQGGICPGASVSLQDVCPRELCPNAREGQQSTGGSPGLLEQSCWGQQQEKRGCPGVVNQSSGPCFPLLKGSSVVGGSHGMVGGVRERGTRPSQGAPTCRQPRPHSHLLSPSSGLWKVLLWACLPPSWPLFTLGP